MPGSSFQGWTYVLQSIHWHACAIQSHALALFIIYFVYHYPWGWQNRDQLLRPPPKKPYPKSRSSYDDGRNALVQDSRSKTASIRHEDLSSLEDTFPTSTAAERKRFLVARQGNLKGAARMLRTYLDWHQKHVDVVRINGIERATTDDEDLDTWNEACRIAMKASRDVTSSGDLPRVIRTHTDKSGKYVTDLGGHRLFQIMPAQMDVSLAKSATYALAVAIYLNNSLDRYKEERIVVCMDVRAGKGWPNTHAMRLIPFMQQTTTLLLSLFPERLHRCYVYPVPSSFLWIWKTISKVVDPLTREKICLMTGPNKIESPPPFEQMKQYMSKSSAHCLEDARLASFLPTNQ